MGTRKQGNRPKRTVSGPVPAVPTQEQIDAAKWLIGRRQYPSKVGVLLAKKFGVSQDFAYRIMDAAREQAVASLAGHGVDPLTGMLLFLESVISDGTLPIRERTHAVGNMCRMLGMDRLLKKMDAGGGVEAYLAKLAGQAPAVPLGDGT